MILRSLKTPIMCINPNPNFNPNPDPKTVTPTHECTSFLCFKRAKKE